MKSKYSLFEDKMAFHNKEKDGPMRQKTIATEFSKQAIESHDEKVNKFNEDNTVFFNSTFLSDGCLVTICLYANGANEPKPKQNKVKTFSLS